LYVSRSGQVQAINRWDINGDGYNDILISCDHDDFETVDAFIYWGSDHGFTSLLPDLWQERPLAQLAFGLMGGNRGLTRLPAFGGGRSLIADLNRDGYPDIVFCNYIHNYPGLRTAYVYWGGAGGFHPANKTELPTNWAAGVAAADLNGDGYPDLVFANQGAEAGLENISRDVGMASYIYWGSATGFDVARRTLLGTRGARDVAIADFNHDGYPDLAFVNNSPYAQEVQVLWGGPGGYSDARTQALPVAVPTSIRSGDLNRDGYDDLVVTTAAKPQTISFEALRLTKQRAEHPVYIFFGGRDGLSAQRTAELPAYEARDTAIGDFNRDGFPDVAIANASDGSTPVVPSFIYWGSSQGFSTQRYTELPTLGASGVVAADLNGDGYPDLAFANSDNGETHDVPSYIYWGSATGFAPYLRSEVQSFGAVSVSAADLNGDGKPDLVLVNQYSGRSAAPVNSRIYWGNPHHYYSTASMTSLPGHGAYGTTIADLNDDGYADIVLCNSYSESSYIYWGGHEGFSTGHRQELAVGSVYTSTAADLNRDGYLDLVFAGMSDGQNVGTILWGSAAGFSEKNRTTLPLKVKRTATHAIADLNRDGYLDLVFADEYFGFMHIFWGGPAGYSEERSWSKLVSAGSVKLADLNGDGYLDFVVAGSFDPEKKSYNTKTRIFWGTPQGTPSPDGVVELEAYGSGECGIADLNRDGYLDLVLSNYMSDSTRSLPIFIYWGGKGGYSNTHRSVLPAESSLGIQTVDLNRDGYPEIVVHNHLKNGDHSISSYIYWNSRGEFDLRRRTELPAFGPHFSQRIDPGNLYTRKLEEEYVSSVIKLPTGAQPHRILWKAEEPHGTKLKFQVRSASAPDLVPRANWSGPAGPASYYDATGAELRGIRSSDRCLQYRAVFTSPDGGEWPALSEVKIQFR
jgi:hypothetical protein